MNHISVGTLSSSVQNVYTAPYCTCTNVVHKWPEDDFLRRN